MAISDLIARARQARALAEAQRYNPDPQGLALSAYQRFSDPGYGHTMMRRLVSQTAAPSFQGLARLTAMSGGSQAVASERMQAGMRSMQDAAFGAALQARQGFDQMALSALGQHFSNEQFRVGLGTQVDMARRAQRASFWDSLLKGAIGIGSVALAPATGGLSLGAGAGMLSMPQPDSALNPDWTLRF